MLNLEDVFKEFINENFEHFKNVFQTYSNCLCYRRSREDLKRTGTVLDTPKSNFTRFSFLFSQKLLINPNLGGSVILPPTVRFPLITQKR